MNVRSISNVKEAQFMSKTLLYMVVITIIISDSAVEAVNPEAIIGTWWNSAYE